MRFSKIFNRRRRDTGSEADDKQAISLEEGKDNVPPLPSKEKVIKKKNTQESNGGVTEEIQQAKPSLTVDETEDHKLVDIVQVQIFVNENENDAKTVETSSTADNTDVGSEHKMSDQNSTICDTTLSGTKDTECKSTSRMGEFEGEFSIQDNSLEENSIGTASTSKSESTDGSGFLETNPGQRLTQQSVRTKRTTNNAAAKTFNSVLERLSERGACICREGKNVMKGCHDELALEDDGSRYLDDDSTVGSLNSEPRMYL